MCKGTALLSPSKEGQTQPHGSKKQQKLSQNQQLQNPQWIYLDTVLIQLVRDRAYLQWMQKCWKTKIFGSSKKPGKKNDLVNESALNEKAFTLLRTHRCFKELLSCTISFSLICNPYCFMPYNLFTYDRPRSQEVVVLLVIARDAHSGVVCTCSPSHY